MKKFRTLSLSVLLAVATLLTPTLFGQSGGATLTGTATDPTGAVIPGARATLTEVASGTKRVTVSNGQGAISFIGIPAATYTIEVSADGYRTLRRTGITVHIDDQLDLRILRLPAASADVSVTYQSSAPYAGNGDGSTGNEFADLLVGRIGGFDQTSKNFMANMVNKCFDFYAQDTWKATSRLTLNYGARLDHLAWWYDTNGNIAVFNPAAYSPAAPFAAASGLQTHATTPSVPISGAKPLSFQFAPSVGFAFDLDGRGNTILRGGFGTNYYVDPGINAFSAVQAPPNLRVVSRTTQL